MDYNYIILEDCQLSLENLRNALKSHTNLREVGHADNAQTGVSLVLKLNPHIVFINAQLGVGNGFDILKEIKQYSPDFPFFIMTADFEKYAKEAVNNDVLYFLDKPVNPVALAMAIVKVEKRLSSFQDFITIKNSEGYFFIDLKTVKYISSNDNYCIIHRIDFPPMTITRTLKDMESMLPASFIRIHKCHIINRNFLQMMNTTTRIVRMNFKETDSNKDLELPIGNMYLEKARHTLLSF